MDDVVKTVEETYELVSAYESAAGPTLIMSQPETERPGFRGSDDDLRARFEEYICGALASIKYADFLTKSKAGDITVAGAGECLGRQAPALMRKARLRTYWRPSLKPGSSCFAKPVHARHGRRVPILSFLICASQGETFGKRMARPDSTDILARVKRQSSQTSD